jgi:hypothetical protein
MPLETPGRPLALFAVAALYLCSLFFSVSTHGHPFPFMGKCYTGGWGEGLFFVDSMISLYLVLGILKRQRLTLWLLIAYNLLDACNALVNLAKLSAGQYASLAQVPLPEVELRLNTLVAVLLLMLLNVYLLYKRRYFNNASPYLF